MAPSKNGDDDGSTGSAGDNNSVGSGSGTGGGAAAKVFVDPDTYPMTGISEPCPNDVLCGRGGGTNNHPGNIRFRKLVNEHKMRYLAATKVEKPKVAREVVKIWRAMDPPGRFLARTGAGTEGGGGKGKDDTIWHDVGDKKAREKASQCLRERTPEVMPFVKKLQAQQQVALAPKAKKETAAAAASTAGADTSFFNGGGAAAAALADPALSAQFLTPEAAAAFGFAMQQQQQQHASAAISSQFLVAAPGSSGSAAQQQHLQEQWVAFQSQQDDFAGSGGFTQFANNAFQQHQLQQQQQAMAAAATAGFNGAAYGAAGAAGGGESDELTLEEYQRSLEEYISKECGLSPEAAARAVDPDEARREAMEEARGNSWIKSFHSIDTQSQSMDMASVTSQSIRNMVTAELASTREDEEEDYADDYADEEEDSGRYGSTKAARSSRRTTAGLSTSTIPTSHLDPDDRHQMPPPDSTTSGRAQKLKQSRAEEVSSSTSNFSMFSEATGLTSVGEGTKSNRSLKMGAARTLKSDISMMSELTDLSGTVSNMSLGR